MTPYRRITQSDDISEAVKVKLTEKYKRLNPAQLKGMIDKLQEKLWRQYNEKKKGLPERVSLQTEGYAARKSKDFIYNLNEATRI